MKFLKQHFIYNIFRFDYITRRRFDTIPLEHYLIVCSIVIFFIYKPLLILSLFLYIFNLKCRYYDYYINNVHVYQDLGIYDIIYDIMFTCDANCNIYDAVYLPNTFLGFFKLIFNVKKESYEALIRYIVATKSEKYICIVREHNLKHILDE